MTANNQYFERNMLINAKKTNTTLESDDWGPTNRHLLILIIFWIHLLPL